MKSFVLTTLAAACLALSEIESSFLSFISEYGRNYGSLEEYGLRLAQFVRTHREIEEHNAKESSFKLGHNKFSDWTIEEYEALLTSKPDDDVSSNESTSEFSVVGDAVPIDWRSKGAVNPIKDQGACASCWAFSANAAVEGAWAIKTGTLYDLSQQYLMDCNKGCRGCNGGAPSSSYVFLQKNTHIEQSEYPYTAEDGTCQSDSKTHTDVQTKGYKSISYNHPDLMKDALANQPLSVFVDGSSAVFRTYSSGIFNSPDCGVFSNHCTDVVGWGIEGDTEFWIMRNSWGTSWGEKGYMRLEIISGPGVCGIHKQPQYPLIL